MRKLVELPSMSRVTPGATATLEVPIRPTYHNIIFTAGGTSLAVANIGRITLYFDGKPVSTWKNLQRLMDLNTYWGRGTDTVNQFVMHFFRRELREQYRRAPGVGTADLQTFHVEIELDSGAPSDITLKAHAWVDPEPQVLGVFVKVREYPFSSAVSGEVEIDKLPRGPFYVAQHFFKDDVSQVEVVTDGSIRAKGTKAVLERTQTEATHARTPLTAKATSVDYVVEGDLAQAVATGSLYDFRSKLTLDTAGSVDIVTETLDVLG